MEINNLYREARNLSLKNLEKHKKTRNIVKQSYDLSNFEKNVNNTYQTMKKKLPFGSTIMNRCKAKELNLYIEKASRMMRELSSSKPVSAQNSIERYHSRSIDQVNPEV